MARRGPETRLVAQIVRALNKEYPSAFITKIHGGPFQQAGLPDLICCVEGKYVGLEVKHPDTSHGVTPLQEATLNLIREAGGTAAVVYSVDDALSTVRAVVYS